ncbi:MAG: 23S rRNA (uracil-5-)-methyltransferase RumA, partial [Candidatus Marinimicrobia bacterium]|nr:23S rRNA (uracil-5-)-methyltransferase RumA [Candidatus Neomarinimicrobiota bacterium]
VDNCEFYEANLDKFLQKNQELIQSLEAPDIAVIDPPRAGIHPKFLKQLVELNPPRIIYVSCNPSTQVRDVEAFLEAGYRVEELQPVDMFPQTWHIESVALLVKSS